eukprot:TRINITY_DN1512_c0_g2_i1.p1 TRINITY_DN1512_c0_g2~~TRINITY_DN1512_c0_g2_i1.p1  ORF type:complete len:646 (+),score=197.64 TRINITY_DN1512_c0_g2_i1:66-1940(+)
MALKAIGKRLLNSVSTLFAWAAGYSAAQVWYTIGTHAIGHEQKESYDSFVTVAGDGTLHGLFTREEAWMALIFNLCFNAVLVVFLVFLVDVQLRIHHDKWKELGGPPPTGAVVFYVRTLDAFADGVTFFTGNLFFLILASLVFHGRKPNDSAQLVLLFAFAIGASVVLGLATLMETAVKRLMLKCGQLTLKRRKQVHLVNDWYIGQWAWLLGYSYWFILWCALTHEYIDAYDHVSCWWFMVGFAMLLWLFGHWALRKWKSSNEVSEYDFGTEAEVPFLVDISEKGVTDTVSSPTPQPPTPRYAGKEVDFLLSGPGTRARLRNLYLSALRWMTGCGAYFTLKQTVHVFGEALAMKQVDRMELAVWTFSATAVAVAIAVFLDELEQRAMDKAEQEPGASETVKRTVRDAYQPLRLTVCYVTGKVWLGFAFGLYGPEDGECWCWGYYSVLTSLTTLMSCLFAYLDARREFTQNNSNNDYPCAGVSTHIHGQFCTCILCGPELYPPAEFPPPAEEEESVVEQSGGYVARSRSPSVASPSHPLSTGGTNLQGRRSRSSSPAGSPCQCHSRCTSGPGAHDPACLRNGLDVVVEGFAAAAAAGLPRQETGQQSAAETRERTPPGDDIKFCQ